jgi:hypothetical protein
MSTTYWLYEVCNSLNVRHTPRRGDENVDFRHFSRPPKTPILAPDPPPLARVIILTPMHPKMWFEKKSFFAGFLPPRKCIFGCSPLPHPTILVYFTIMTGGVVFRKSQKRAPQGLFSTILHPLKVLCVFHMKACKRRGSWGGVRGGVWNEGGRGVGPHRFHRFWPFFRIAH